MFADHIDHVPDGGGDEEAWEHRMFDTPFCKRCRQWHFYSRPCVAVRASLDPTGLAAAWHVDGSASIEFDSLACGFMDHECCSPNPSREDEGLWIPPDRAWHLLQALRAYLDEEQYRRAAEAISRANGPDPAWEVRDG